MGSPTPSKKMLNNQIAFFFFQFQHQWFSLKKKSGVLCLHVCIYGPLVVTAGKSFIVQKGHNQNSTVTHCILLFLKCTATVYNTALNLNTEQNKFISYKIKLEK